MIPHRVKLKNFLCHGEQEFTFDGHAVWLLHGANGVGKSAVFDAILYCLYGEHKRRDSHKAKVAELIRYGERSMRVEFEFECGPRRYCVWRARGRSGGPTQGVDEIIGSVREPLGVGDHEADLDRWVEDTIGLSGEAFVSAVLLRQGAAERLIDAKKEARRDLFRGIIDLEPFIALHESVFEARKEKNAEVDLLKKQLTANETRISIEQVDAAKASYNAAGGVLQSARDSEAAIRDMLEQARTWEGLNADLKIVRGELEAASARMQRADKLECDVARLQELRLLLPQLKLLSEKRTAHAAKKGGESKSRTLVESLTIRRDALQSKVNEFQTAGQKYAGTCEDLKQAIASRTAALKELQAEIDRAEKAAEQYRLLAEDEKALTQLPALLDGQRREAAEAMEAAQAAKDALPHLRTLSGQREAFHQAAAALKAATGSETEYAAKKDRAAAAKAKAIETEKVANAALAEAREHYAVLKDRIKDVQIKQQRFLQEADAQICSACGQPVDEAHAEKERLSFEKQLQEAEAERLRVEESGKTLKKSAEDATKARIQCEADAGTAETGLNGARQQWQLAEQKSAMARRTFQDALAGLAAEIARNVPAIELTGFPAESDVAAASRAAGELAAAQRKLSGCDALIQKRQSLEGAIRTRREAVKAIGAPPDVSAARTQATTLLKELQTLNRELEAENKLRDGAASDERSTVANLKTVTGELSSATAQWNDAVIASALAGQAFEQALAAVPIAFHGEVDHAALAKECQALEEAKVEEHAAAAANDRSLQKQREARRAELDAKIEAIPEASRRPASVVDLELKAAQATAKKANDELAAAKSDWDRLQGQRDRRQKLEADLLQAEKEQARHNTLVDLLGETGLQQALTAAAGRRILDHADDALASISEGELRFERSEAGENDFDLQIRRTGCPEPIPVGGLSGGQRCRVAVSLALAVCRFAAGQARPLETLFIDEAFAQLDPPGRRAMIDLLRGGTIAQAC